MSPTTSPLLRRVLVLDAVASAAAALLLLLGAPVLADRLGLPEALLRGAGLVLLPFVALVAWAARRPVAEPALVGAIAACNAAWVVASIALVALALPAGLAPTALGHAFVLAQALVVAVFARLQVVGLRRVAAGA